ncbi:MAG: permease-like cell division protein FtsX [Burkholderiales bacterium]
MMAWLSINFHAFAATLKKLAGSPLSSFFSICVIGIALSLPTGIYVLLENLESLSKNFTGSPQISLFLAKDASSAEVSEIEKRLKGNSGVDHFKFIPKDEALDEFRKDGEFSDVVASLSQNPLPDAFVVFARENSAKNLESLHQEMLKWPKVAHAQLDSNWAKKLDSFLKLGHVATSILATLLGFALVFITFNTIRLQILTQKDEIEVAKLIGATNTFIRRPFLYLGALQGLAGGIAAWGIIAAGLHFMNGAMAELAELYSTRFILANLDIKESLLLFLLSSALGWLGAWLSVSRHLWQLDTH